LRVSGYRWQGCCMCKATVGRDVTCVRLPLAGMLHVSGYRWPGCCMCQATVGRDVACVRLPLAGMLHVSGYRWPGCCVCQATVGRDVACVRLPFAFQEEKRTSSHGRSKELANRAAGGTRHHWNNGKYGAGKLRFLCAKEIPRTLSSV